MIFDWFKKKQKKCLGIDFGTSAFKVVELTRDSQGRIYLSNYAMAQTSVDSSLNLTKLDLDDATFLLRSVFDRAGIKTKKAVVSLSVGETFSTVINLPSMPENELAQAIPFQAKKYVPIPIEEVVFDWSVVGEFVESQQNAAPPVDSSQSPAPKEGQPAKTIQVLIVAVPREIIKKIAQIAKRLDLKISAIEQEAFSIMRALVGNDRGTYLVIDLGMQNTDLIIIDGNVICLTYSFEKNKPIDFAAESFKIISSYQARYNKKITRIILSGGGAPQSNWVKVISDKLGVKMGLGEPFARLSFDSKLQAALKELGPFLAVSVGGALREI